MSFPPPEPNFAPPPTGAPPGYVSYELGANNRIRPSKGLSKAMIVMFWCTTGAAALAAVALYLRKMVWDDFVDGGGSFNDLDRADSLVRGAFILQFLLSFASAVVCAIWSKRIADNAKARGARGIRPGLAAGGWFIPIGWLWVGFNQLKMAIEAFYVRSKSLSRWQMCFVGQAIVGYTISRFGNFENVSDPVELADKLRNQSLVGVLGVGLYAGAAFFAKKAAHDVDTAVTIT